MQDYRETIIKQIIYSPDTLSVESVIDSSLEKLAKNGTHPFIVVRFIDKLKASLNEIKSGEVSDLGRRNVLQALNVLTDHDIKKIIGTKIRNI